LYEIKSTYILQPGPASLTEGVQQLHGVLAAWEARHRDVV
jgi:iron complex transport system substrate-binding protein